MASRMLTRRQEIPALLALVAAPSPVATLKAQAPEPADTILAAAQKRAAASKKNVLVVFHASWCGWCKRLDRKVLNDPEMGKLVARSFEVVHLDVQESGPQKALENPGGAAVLAKLGGAKSGLPFYAVLDPAGKKMGDSNVMPGGKNIGYPAAPEEIAAFTALLRKTGTNMTEADRTRLAAHLQKNAPK